MTLPLCQPKKNQSQTKERYVAVMKNAKFLVTHLKNKNHVCLLSLTLKENQD